LTHLKQQSSLDLKEVVGPERPLGPFDLLTTSLLASFSTLSHYCYYFGAYLNFETPPHQ
jgi:hypothetical protein